NLTLWALPTYNILVSWCEASLEDIFNGRLFELLDAALSDTVSRFHVDIQYGRIDECSDMGIAPESKATTESVYNAALALGIATQLTNILRNIGEIYSNYKLLLYLHITPRGCLVMNSFVHSLPMLLGPFKNVVRCVLDPPNVGNPNFVFEGKTIQRMEP
ncbi:hypothetical protein H5410_030897, partial [Solanum commersonii]